MLSCVWACHYQQIKIYFISKFKDYYFCPGWMFSNGFSRIHAHFLP